MSRVIWLTVAALGGAVAGALVMLFVLAAQRPEPMETPQPRPGTSDLTLTIDRTVLEREAQQRMGPTLERYELREPKWQLVEGNTAVLQTKGRLPLFGTDVAVTTIIRLVVVDGALAVEIERIDYGVISLGGDAIEGLAADLNADLTNAIDPSRFQVEDVRTTPDSVTIRLKIVGEL